MNSGAFWRTTAVQRSDSCRIISRALRYRCRKAPICCFLTVPVSAGGQEEVSMRFCTQDGMWASAGRPAVPSGEKITSVSMWRCRRQGSWKRLSECGNMYSRIRKRLPLPGLKVKDRLTDHRKKQNGMMKQMMSRGTGLRLKQSRTGQAIKSA